MKLGTAIRRLREQNDWTQDELARRIGHKRGSHISNWESDKIRPQIRNIEKLNKVFGLDIEEYAKLDIEDEQTLAERGLISVVRRHPVERIDPADISEQGLRLLLQRLIELNEIIIDILAGRAEVSNEARTGHPSAERISDSKDRSRR